MEYRAKPTVCKDSCSSPALQHMWADEPTLPKCRTGFCSSPTRWAWKKASFHHASVARWRMRLEAQTVLRTGLAEAEGVCSLQNPPLSLPQTQSEAQFTIPGPALPACCTFLAPALSRQGTSPCQRSCSFLRDEHSSFLELPELCHWVMAQSALCYEGRGPFPEFSRKLSCITQWWEHIHNITEAGRLLSTLWSCDRQGLFENWCLIMCYINRTNPSLPWGRNCCFIHVAKRTKSQITSLSLSKPPHLVGQPRTCIHKELWTRAADTFPKPSVPLLYPSQQSSRRISTVSYRMHQPSKLQTWIHPTRWREWVDEVISWSGWYCHGFSLGFWRFLGRLLYSSCLLFLNARFSGK